MVIVLDAKLSVLAEKEANKKNGGIEGLRIRFKELTKNLPYNFVRRVGMYARQKAPVRTGYLKSSIKNERLETNVHRVIVEAYYGIYVNYGTRYMHAQPFWEPAIEQAILDMREEIKEVLHG